MTIIISIIIMSNKWSKHYSITNQSLLFHTILILAKSYVKALEQGDIEEIRKLEEFMFKLPQERFPTGVKSGEISPVIKEVFEEMGFNL